MPRKHYAVDVKKDAVAAFEASSKTLKEFSDAIDIPESTIGKWLIKFGRKTKAEPPSEIEQLKRQLYEVTMERDILKKSIAIFARTPEGFAGKPRG